MCQYIVALREKQREIKECLMVEDISVISGTGKEIYEMSVLGEIMHVLKCFYKCDKFSKNKIELL